MRSKLVLFLVTISIVGLLSGCSLFRKKGEGEGSLSESDLDASQEGRFGEGSIPLAEGEGLFRDIKFGYDSADLDETARMDIEANVQVLKSEPALKVQLEGHCDERGTADYNLALGARRARAVQDVLLSLGVGPARVETISYGEEVPLDTGHGEASWARNRRVHFAAYKNLPSAEQGQ